jgi:hypothetical protein
MAGESAVPSAAVSGVEVEGRMCVDTWVWQWGAPLYQISPVNVRRCVTCCAGGIKTRIVYCGDDMGEAVDDGLCKGTKPGSEVMCNREPCDFCADNSCNQRGVCTDNKCVCSPDAGFSGAYCEVRQQLHFACLRAACA